MAFDVFNDHNGIVYHESGRQRDSEQRQGVDGESQQLDESKSADQRNRDGHRGDDGTAPFAQKNKDDKNDENDGDA